MRCDRMELVKKSFDRSLYTTRGGEIFLFVGKNGD